MVNNASDILVFDRSALRKNRNRCARNPGDHTFLFDWASTRVAERLFDIRRRFPMALQIGARADFTSDKIDQKIIMDVSTDQPDLKIIADEDFLPFKENSFDLITSALNLHSVNDLPGALLQIRKTLKPDGLLIAALFGGETLMELRESLMQAELELKGGISPRVSPFADKQQIGALLQRAGFALPVIDSEIVTVTYDTIFKLMHDLRFMGEGNIIRDRHKYNPGKSFFMKAAEYYQDKYSEKDGRIRASFEIIFLIGWAPHASQQKPLRPGSAKNRLADALSTQEIKTGEKTLP